jgi:hypothetical protein
MLHHMRNALAGVTLLYRFVSVSTLLVLLVGGLYNAASRQKEHHD